MTDELTEVQVDRAFFGDEYPDPSPLLAGLRNGEWLSSQDFPPLQYHLPGIIPEGSGLLVGPPKVGKSCLVLALALAAAAGGRALGLKVRQRPNLYLALEDGHRRLQDRCRTLLGGDRIPPDFEYLTKMQPGTVLATIRAWLERHPGAAPLVILDTLGKVMPPALPGESAYQRDYRVGSAVQRLADEHPGAAILINHHDRKAASDDFVERVSGTNGLAGSADTIIVLSRGRHEPDGLVSVTGRDVPEGEYAVRFDGARALWSLDGGGLTESAAKATERRATAGVGDRLAEVIGYVTGNYPVSPADVAGGLGMDPKAASAYLSRAVAANRLARPTRGSYTPVGSVGSVGMDDANPTDPTDPTPLWEGEPL